MKFRFFLQSSVFCLFFIFSSTGLCYVGPGAGIPVIGSLLGILAAIFLAVIAIIGWPIRRMLKKRRLQKANSNGDDPGKG